jgi:hypothetical protein
MVIVLVQSRLAIINGAASTTLAFSSNLTASNFATTAQVGFAGGGASAAPTTPTDTLGHTYTGARAALAATTDNQGRMFYVKSTSAGADTVTMGQANSGDFTIAIAEWSGGDATDPRAAEAGTDGTGTGTAINVGTTGTRADADGLILSWFSHMGANTTLTSDTGDGFSLLQENEGGTSNMPLHVQYLITTNTTAITVNGTVGASRQWFGQQVTFKAATGGGGASVAAPLLMMMGIGG